MAGGSSREDPTLSDGAAPVVGKLFANRYRIEALLGRGGMGSVYRAHDREVDELVALKTLDTYTADDRAVERFRRWKTFRSCADVRTFSFASTRPLR